MVNQSLSAVWNEVLTIHNIRLFKMGSSTFEHYPCFMMCLFDDNKGKNELIGIGSVEVSIKYLPEIKVLDVPNKLHLQIPNVPVVPVPGKINIQQIFHDFKHHFPPHWRWIQFCHKGFNMGEVLLSVELTEISVPTLIDRPVVIEEIPKEISPVMRKFRYGCSFFCLWVEYLMSFLIFIDWNVFSSE